MENWRQHSLTASRFLTRCIFSSFVSLVLVSSSSSLSDSVSLSSDSSSSSSDSSSSEDSSWICLLRIQSTYENWKRLLLIQLPQNPFWWHDQVWSSYRSASLPRLVGQREQQFHLHRQVPNCRQVPEFMTFYLNVTAKTKTTNIIFFLILSFFWCQFGFSGRRCWRFIGNFWFLFDFGFCFYIKLIQVLLNDGYMGMYAFIDFFALKKMHNCLCG